MNASIGFIKSRFRPYKHALLRLASLQLLRLRRLTHNHNTPRIERISTDTQRLLSPTLTPRPLAPVGDARPYLTMDSAGQFPAPPAKTLGPSRLTTDARTMYPARFVVRLANVRVLGEAGHVVTSDGTLLADISFQNPATCYSDTAWADLSKPHQPAERLAGTTCHLISKWGSYNYFHFLFELLPRCEMIRKSGVDFDGIDQFLLNPLLSDIYWQGLSEFGIVPERVRLCEADSTFQVSDLIAASTLRSTGHMRNWVCEWLRETFAPAKKNPRAPVRLYLGRDDAKTRRLTNQPEILQEILEPLGFESVKWEGGSIREQAARFANAEIVVAVNGAALSNLVFCKPGTRVLVFHYPTYLSRFYYELCHTLGLDFYYIVGETTTPIKAGDYTSDYFVSPDRLKALLKLAQVN